MSKLMLAVGLFAALSGCGRSEDLGGGVAATTASAGTIAVCGAQKGHAYYPAAGMIEEGKDGWQNDKMTGGSTTLTQSPEGELDILFKDARGQITSARAEGGDVLLVRSSENETTVLVAYSGGTQTVEIYSFVREVDGRAKMLQLASRGLSGDVVIPKAGVYIAACSILRSVSPQASAERSPATSEPGRPSASLDGLVRFADPQTCTPNEAFGALLNGLVGFEAGGTPILNSPPIPADFKSRVGTPELQIDGREYRATLPLRGDWQGLPLRSVTVIGWMESEWGFELVFDANRAQVLAMANRVGFDIPASGSKYQDDEVLGLNVGVADRPGGAALYCIPA